MKKIALLCVTMTRQGRKLILASWGKSKKKKNTTPPGGKKEKRATSFSGNRNIINALSLKGPRAKVEPKNISS